MDAPAPAAAGGRDAVTHAAHPDRGGLGERRERDARSRALFLRELRPHGGRAPPARGRVDRHASGHDAAAARCGPHGHAALRHPRLGRPRHPEPGDRGAVYFGSVSVMYGAGGRSPGFALRGAWWRTGGTVRRKATTACASLSVIAA